MHAVDQRRQKLIFGKSKIECIPVVAVVAAAVAVVVVVVTDYYTGHGQKAGTQTEWKHQHFIKANIVNS
jgi:hypothetical protein